VNAPSPELGAALDVATDGLALQESTAVATRRSVAEQRRSRTALSLPLHALSLVDVDGVLRFEHTRAPQLAAGRRRRRQTVVGLGGTVVREFQFESLSPSDIGRYLDTLDRKLNPARGIRQLRWTAKGAVLEAPSALKPGRTLLFVHGTFSRSESFLNAFNATEHGRVFLQTISKPPSRGGAYAQVLTFDHATVGVSPVMNAFDLARATQEIPGPIDVICHSRGGLVTRWWLTGFRPDFGDARVVFVGAPLAGTSLAAAPRLKESLEFVSNIANVFVGASTLASVAVPLLSVATGLMKVVASVTSLSAGAPLLDAVMAMIPGLAAQGRVGNNPELLRLQQLVGEAPPRWYGVQANFEPDPVGWKFWKRFVRLGSEITDAASDLVFRDRNDLVVDTGSMSTLSDTMRIPAKRTLDFGTTGLVHHCNYFEQPQTTQFLTQVLGTP